MMGYLGRSWVAHGQVMGSPWVAHGQSMKCAWAAHVLPMGASWAVLLFGGSTILRSTSQTCGTSTGKARTHVTMSTGVHAVPPFLQL